MSLFNCNEATVGKRSRISVMDDPVASIRLTVFATIDAKLVREAIRFY